MLDDISVVSGPSADFLNEWLTDYRSEHEACLRWLLSFGKGPETATGFAHGSQ